MYNFSGSRIALTVPLLDTNEHFKVFKILPVPNLKTNQSTLLARYNIEEKAVVIDDVRRTYTTLSETKLASCLKQHGHFCSIDKYFYSVNPGNLCVIRVFLKDLPGIAILYFCRKQCSRSKRSQLTRRQMVD